MIFFFPVLNYVTNILLLSDNPRINIYDNARAGVRVLCWGRSVVSIKLLIEVEACVGVHSHWIFFFFFNQSFTLNPYALVSVNMFSA